MHSILQDVRVAVRQIARHRSFSTIVVVTLALGIGAITTFFSLLNGFVFRPLPYADADRLVAIHAVEESANRSEFRLAYPTFSELTRSTSVLESAVAYETRQYNAAQGGSAERLEGTAMSGDVFGMLGIPLATGRPFSAAEHRDAAPVAILSNTVWTRHYSADPAILGRTLMLDGTAHVIVGVAPPHFNFPGATQVWIPLAGDALTIRRVNAAARLRAGISIEQASAALTSAAAHLGPEHRLSRADWRPALVPFREAVLTDKHRNALGVLLAAAALVLIAACANLAGLLLAHLAGRRHEIAVRSAVGARRGHIVRLLLTESLVLAVAGGGLGVLLTHWGVALFVGTLGRPKGAEWLDFPVDANVLLFALLASIATAALFGVAPALGATRVDLRGVLQEDAQGQTTPRGRRLRVALVAAQIAVSLGLLAGASSIVASSRAADSIDPGFDRERLLWVRVTLAGPGYDSPERRLAFVDAATERLQALPGAGAVSAVSHLPLADRNLPHTLFMLEGWTPQGQLPYASLRSASSTYLEALSVPLRAGRFFTAAEARDPHARVAVINETMANRYWPGADPTGKPLRLMGPALNDAWVTVAGVVGDVAQRGVPSRPENQIYLPLPHTRDITLAVRAVHDPAALVEPARRAVASIDATLPTRAQTMEQTYAGYARDLRLQAGVVGALGAVALALAALGIYAVMALLVTQQQREIAVRMALGSTRGTMLRLVLRRTAHVTAFGLAGGMLLAICVTTGLSWIFFGVRPFDARVLAGTALLLAAVALFASWWPARRAMRVEPAAVLRRTT